MERPDERKTMVFITHSIDEAILLGDRIAVMSARPGRIKEMLDMPFGRPRDVEAVRADPRFAELRAHIWHELHTARPQPTRGGGMSTFRFRPVGACGRRRCRGRARAEKVAAARRRNRQFARSSPSASCRSRSCSRSGRCSAPASIRSLFTTPSAIAVAAVDMIEQRRAVDLSVAEPRGAGDRADARGHRRHRHGACCWRASGSSTSRFGVYITFLYSIPSVALVPLIVLWAGFETTAKVIILFLFAFFPMAINTYQGVKNVDPKLIEVGRAFRCSERQLWTNIVLPGALPFIVTGLRLAVGRGLIGMVLADLYTAISGIGYLIVRTASTYQVDKMFVPIVTLGLLGVTLTALLRVLEIRWRRGRHRAVTTEKRDRDEITGGR